MNDLLQTMRRLCAAVRARELQPLGLQAGRDLHAALHEAEAAIKEADADNRAPADDWHGSDCHA